VKLPLRPYLDTMYSIGHSSYCTMCVLYALGYQSTLYKACKGAALLIKAVPHPPGLILALGPVDGHIRDCTVHIAFINTPIAGR